MQFDNQKTRNVADVVAKILAGESAEQEPKMLEEELKGDQHKIDANKNNKIDAHDFKLLRAKKKMKEEAEQIDELKKSTLGSYVKKASKDLAGQSFEHGEDEHRQYGDPEDTERENEMKKRERDIENRQKGINRAATKLSKEETELTESHFKVGDEVVCKASGMEGEVVKVDPKEEGKYYTVKREDGKMVKYAPNELKKEEELTQEEFDAFSEEDKNLYMEMLDSVETQLREIGLLDEEQLDEISVTAAKNYLHKALPSSSKLNQKAAKPGEEASKASDYSYENAPYETKEFKKFSKRRTGIRKAINKLASAHPENKKHAKMARRAFDSIHNANYRVGMGEPNDNDRANIRDAHKTVKAAVNAMHKNAMKEGVGLDEAMWPGSKEYNKKYGKSPQQKLKKKGDTVPTSQGDMTKTDKGIAHRRRFTEMLESYTQGGLKYIASLVKEEPDNEEYTKEVEDQKAKMDGKKRGGDVAKASVQAVKNEEVEQIDELSKSTLGSYAKKASHDARIKMAIGKDFERHAITSRKPEYKAGAKSWEDKYKSDARKREAGVNKAIDRLAKEEVEQIDEISQKLATAAYAKRTSTMSHNDPVARKKEDAAYERIGKRWGQKGQQKADAAADKYQAEEVEQIDELDQKTLSKYTTRAKFSSDPKHREGAAKAQAKMSGMSDKLRQGKLNNPMMKSMAKEEVELDERSLTEPEMKKKEEIVMSMKKKMPGFKERYGERAKEVMYATATKMAKKD